MNTLLEGGVVLINNWKLIVGLLVFVVTILYLIYRIKPDLIIGRSGDSDPPTADWTGAGLRPSVGVNETTKPGAVIPGRIETTRAAPALRSGDRPGQADRRDRQMSQRQGRARQGMQGRGRG
jgi:hypothetical protein